MKLNLEIGPAEEVNLEKCKGLFYRCRVQEWATHGSIGVRVTYRLLKRRSCPGCDQCGYIIDDMRERTPSFGGSRITWPDRPKDGAIYRPAITNISTDWESGYPDDWDVEMKEVLTPITGDKCEQCGPI